MVKNYTSLIPFFLVLFFFSTETIAQCAGDDVSIEVCDIPNISSQAIALFPLLGPNAISGGTWSDDLLSRGLNVTTGVLNAQVIPSSGVYTYTYTVADGSCADTSATVTVTVGGYAGIAVEGTACSDETAFNLFGIFDSTALSPQSNGTWIRYDNGAEIPVTNLMNAEALGLGTFFFKYTVGAIGSCSKSETNGKVTVVRAAKAGDASVLLLCDNDDLSAFTNYDLNDLLAGEDAGGTWADNNNGTNQITFLKDHNIDAQYIYNNFGIGNYTFSYTVLPDNPKCEKKTSTVRIRIEKLIDLTGATLVVSSDICESQISSATYSVTLTQGPAPIPNGTYYVTYTVSGPAGATVTELLNFNNGVLNFPLSSQYFQQVGDFRVEITGIAAVGSEGACDNVINNLFDILNVYRTPVLDGALLTIAPICQNKDALVQISNAVFLENGTYDIVYNLSGANNLTPQNTQIVSVGGISSFVIPSSAIVNDGNTIVRITSIKNVVSNCSNTSNVSGTMVVKPLPNPANIKIVVDDYCLNKPVSAVVSGLGTLQNITITYTLTGANVATENISLVVNGGNTNFTIPSNLLTNTGLNTISITYLVNDDTACDIAVTTVFDAFSINQIPNAPTATNSQNFCETDAATVASLIPNSSQYQWFDSATATTPLANSIALISGNYYVREIGLVGLCVSDPTMITVTINDIPAPTLNQDGQFFCGISQPVISDLSANTNATNSIVWYDAATNGNLLPNNTALTDNLTYYGFDYSTATGCYSKNNIAVTVSLTDCSTTSYEFFIPDGFSPNGDGVNDYFTIPEIEFLYPDYTLEIYSRYGNMMFKGNKNKPNWDGRNSESAGFSDAIAPNGVYFYIVNFNKDNKSPQQGRLYLNR